jgi:hypothetical protein
MNDMQKKAALSTAKIFGVATIWSIAVVFILRAFVELSHYIGVDPMATFAIIICLSLVYIAVKAVYNYELYEQETLDRLNKKD